jgi:hypothetical protein
MSKLINFEAEFCQNEVKSLTLSDNCFSRLYGIFSNFREPSVGFAAKTKSLPGFKVKYQHLS